MAATNHAQAIKKDSQTYLTTALLQLLKTHDLDTITVTQVVKRAGVSRMAFYRNFATLDDLLTTYFAPAIAARFQDVLQHVPANQKLLAMGQFFSELAPTLRLAEQRGFESIIQRLFDDNMMIYYQTTMENGPLTAVQLKYWTKFMSAGVYAIWREWLLGGQLESLTTIHELLATLQTATMQALTKPRN
ncbi:TetR/AcrR family transcriptional regulator [Lactiplantibacillus paraplantarum]|uniref:TetR/AcrR family transcriptional regulator n=1 Tax=Lactiplantibacillus paraplantarum TaxID=60520 RepID=UPI000513BD50|nr:TetR/AcrR family transcriptional regulator [Lactiplantibacillus paraplantarum]ALO05127.1 TetR family transcriptional regulator [Lactiplantibacillus paraplantarum]KGE75932.1 TetR family transcriptional regulator [Lactiplantibacillus paraplantarum]MCT4456153.1 TetR/AcrR family transcriptional regulator [Lactiplantibacillus paraplantarum]